MGRRSHRSQTVLLFNLDKLSKSNFDQQALPSLFQELGTLLNSLKEGVKTVTAITKYGDD